MCSKRCIDLPFFAGSLMEQKTTVPENAGFEQADGQATI
jgi:hypothetical protein